MQHAKINQITFKEEIYTKIMEHSDGRNNDPYFATFIAAWISNTTVLPAYLGLDRKSYSQLVETHFPGYDASMEGGELGDVGDRQDELSELNRLMISHRANEDGSELWMAQIVAQACMGSDHLWQDLGLWSRTDLTQLLMINFPSLAQNNDRNMKWKRFFYKQLCVQEGIYTCRSPSCEVCADYQVCFGPES